MKYNLFYAGYNFDSKIEQIGFLSSDDFYNWTKSEKDPLVSILQVPGFTDEQTSNPCVVFVGGLYKMWYQAKSKDGMFSVMYAESKDLKNWFFKHEPVLTLGKGESFRFGVQHPHIVYENGEYKMWFTIVRDNKSVFAYAESADGIKWQILNDSMMIPEKKWEGRNIFYPMVIKEGDVYKMWYTGKSFLSKWSIGYAESKDGISWIKEEAPIISIFVLPKIIRRAFEYLCKILNIDLRIPLYGIGSPFVWKENDKYFLVGHEIGTHGKLYIPLYESLDGKKWKKIKKNILEKINFEDWDSFFQGDPYIYVK